MWKARGRTSGPKVGMNKLEEKYSRYLELRKANHEILCWGFERLKFKLADRTFYSPDFYVIAGDSTIEIHETKGFWEEDARVKIKVAAEQFPWIRFIAVTEKRKKDGGGWEYEEF